MGTDTVYLTTSEIAAKYRVNPSTVRRWVERGVIIPSFTTPGGHHRFRESDLASLMNVSAA